MLGKPHPSDREPRHSRRGLPRIGEWFLRSAAMRDARAAADEPPARQRARMQAQLLAEVARRVVEPLDALPSGSFPAVQLALCRDATYWALLAMESDDGAAAHGGPSPDLATLWARAPIERLELAAGGADAAEAVRSTLTDGAPPYALDTAQAAATLARTFTERLVADLDAPQRRIDRLWMQRWLRVGVLVAAVLGVVFGARAVTLGPNLIAGKTFRTSSGHPGCAQGCEGLLFHTENENSPWIEYDLGAPRTVKRVEVTNRLDCCGDRAAPLLVEVSTDHTSWKEVARRDLEFIVWTASFPRTTARYVRLRVPRPTALHLKEIVIR